MDSIDQCTEECMQFPSWECGYLRYSEGCKYWWTLKWQHNLFLSKKSPRFYHRHSLFISISKSYQLLLNKGYLCFKWRPKCVKFIKLLSICHKYFSLLAVLVHYSPFCNWSVQTYYRKGNTFGNYWPHSQVWDPNGIQPMTLPGHHSQSRSRLVQYLRPCRVTSLLL